MNKNFLPYQQSLELMELGFDEPCFAIYNDFELVEVRSDLGVKNAIPSPLFQQAFRFFREKYGYVISIEKYKNYGYEWCVYNDSYLKKYYNSDTYEEAELECIKSLIKISKN